MPYKLMVGVETPDGLFIPVQPLQNYNQGQRCVVLSLIEYGRKLFDILSDDLGYISIENNKLQFSYIFTQDIIGCSMRLLDKIAEAIVVRNCNNDQNINKRWFKIARKAKRQSAKSKHYFAIGTGLKNTMKLYPQKYSPSDTQRDIKWLNKKNPKKELMMIEHGTTDGNVAGVQLKISLKGKDYVLRDLQSNRYEVPVVYFSMNLYNDFAEVAQALYHAGKNIVIGEDFVDAESLDQDTYFELREYVPLIFKIVKNELTPEDLLNSQDKLLCSSLLSTIMEPFSSLSIRTNIVN